MNPRFNTRRMFSSFCLSLYRVAVVPIIGYVHRASRIAAIGYVHAVSRIAAIGCAVLSVSACGDAAPPESRTVAYIDARVAEPMTKVMDVFNTRYKDKQISLVVAPEDTAVAKLFSKSACFAVVGGVSGKTNWQRDSAAAAAKGIYLRRNHIARDALCIIVHPDIRPGVSSSIPNRAPKPDTLLGQLTLAALKGILTGATTEWTAIDTALAASLKKSKAKGNTLPVKLFLPSDKELSGSLILNELKAGLSIEKWAPDAVACNSAKDIIDAVGKTKGGIGVITMTATGFGTGFTKSDTTFDVLKLAADSTAPPRAPYLGNVIDKSYPLVYEFYLIYPEAYDLSISAASFVSGRNQGEGQELFGKLGLTPMMLRYKNKKE